MFEEVTEPLPNARESETSQNVDNNRYTQVEENYIFNEVEEYKQKEDENAYEDNKENEKENIYQANTISNPNNQKNMTKIKIILLGEPGVGKSCLINRYVSNKFIEKEKQQESEINIKNVNLDDKTNIELSIYDTTNEKKLGKITKNYYKDAYGAIIVFDLTNKTSSNKVKFWLKELNSHAPRDIVICLLGNKSDLINERNVAYEDAKDLAGDNLYYEVSAKTGNNVTLAFEQITYEIMEKQNEEKNNPDKVPRGKEGRKTADLNDINMINKELNRKKKCC